MMPSLIRRLHRDARGTSIIELALVAPILALLIVGMTDLARGLAAKLALEQAAHRALEQAAVGSVQSDYSYLGTEAATAAGSGAAATVDQWLECDGTRQPAFDGACADGQMTARYVKIDVSRAYAPSFNYARSPWHFLPLNANGTVSMSGSAALRVQ